MKETASGASPGLARRRFLAMTTATAAGCCLAAPVAARAAAPPERALSFYNIHTGERLRRVYWAEGWYIDEALDEIDHLLRDFRTGEIKQIDLRLLNVLHQVHASLDTKEPFSVISGYRSPETNAMLARRSGGVAKNSFHIHGMAIDVRVAGRYTEDIRWIAMGLHRGGVGYYPDSNFVHMDVGPVRYW